ncbi:MAG TPA: hypothetical protein VHD83_01715 [Puia sp.]|nr:hypothetical protein [Puia sp.]
MTTSVSQYRTNMHVLRPLISGILGIMLLLPASFFILTMLARIFLGTKRPYHYIAPSFLQSPFDPLALHKAQFIIGCLLLAIIMNGLVALQLQLQKGRWGWEVEVSYRRHWLNTAIALQAVLLLVTLLAYTLIQHIRY